MKLGAGQIQFLVDVIISALVNKISGTVVSAEAIFQPFQRERAYVKLRPAARRLYHDGAYADGGGLYKRIQGNSQSNFKGKRTCRSGENRNGSVLAQRRQSDFLFKAHRLREHVVKLNAVKILSNVKRNVVNLFVEQILHDLVFWVRNVFVNVAASFFGHVGNKRVAKLFGKVKKLFAGGARESSACFYINFFRNAGVGKITRRENDGDKKRKRRF